MTTINKELALNAYSGMSFSPEKRGRQVIEDYENELAADYKMLSAYADTDEKKSILEAEFSKYRDGYTARTNAWLGAKSRTISPMITGPANFPVERNQKRMRSEHNRLTALLEYRPWALNRIEKKLRPELRPIMAGDGDAQERLKAKIEEAEERQAYMKKVNGIIRKNMKGGADAQRLALAQGGLTGEQVDRVMTKDCFGGIGFASFSLTNNNANIKRMKGRLFNISRNQAKETTKVEGANAKYEDCPKDNRVRLFFPGKPEEQIRKELKSAGFRWSPTIGAWQAYRNPWSIDKAKKVAGVA